MSSDRRDLTEVLGFALVLLVIIVIAFVFWAGSPEGAW